MPGRHITNRQVASYLHARQRGCTQIKAANAADISERTGRGLDQGGQIKDVVAGWSEADVARHALAILPVRSGPGLEPLRVTPAVLERYAGNSRWVSQQRARLCSPSWLLRKRSE